MASRGRGARLKGGNFERKLAKIFTEETGFEAHRGLGQTRRGGKEVADVKMDDIDLLHIEAKKQKKCNIKAALEQAINDAEGTDRIPVAITADDRKPILVTMLLEDFFKFFNAYIKEQSKTRK